MTKREAVVSEITHHETWPMPYTLDWTAEAAEGLTRLYGSDEWVGKVAPYIIGVGGARGVGFQTEPGEGRDSYGSLWRAGIEVQMVIEPAIKSSSDIPTYRFPDADLLYPAEAGTAQAGWASELDAFTTASIGPGVFERAWMLRGFEDLLADAASEPAAADLLFERVTEHQMALLELVLELPVDGVKFSDDWSDQRGVMLGPDRWRKMLKPRIAKLYAKAKSAGKFTLQHCCGNLSDIVPDLAEIGLDVLQSVQPEAMDVYQLKRDYGRDITFWGGVGSQSILPFGTPDQIRAEVKKLVTEMGKGGGYILGPAKSVLADTPPANFAALVESFLTFSGHSTD
jgi:uroporphyrinogen decarboxylase